MFSSSPNVPSFFSPLLESSLVLGLFFRTLKGPFLPGDVTLFFEDDLQTIVSGLLGLLVQGEHHHRISPNQKGKLLSSLPLNFGSFSACLKSLDPERSFSFSFFFAFSSAFSGLPLPGARLGLEDFSSSVGLRHWVRPKLLFEKVCWLTSDACLSAFWVDFFGSIRDLSFSYLECLCFFWWQIWNPSSSPLNPSFWELPYLYVLVVDGRCWCYPWRKSAEASDSDSRPRSRMNRFPRVSSTACFILCREWNRQFHSSRLSIPGECTVGQKKWGSSSEQGILELGIKSREAWMNRGWTKFSEFSFAEGKLSKLAIGWRGSGFPGLFQQL